MKTFLSIGTGPGMGIETAERFAREGFKVVLSARNRDKTEALAKDLRGKGYDVVVKDVDASNAAAIAALVADVESSVGAIDVLHYNAAAMRQATIAEQPRDSFNTDLAVNIGGAQAAIQAVASGMTSRKAGTILLTGGGFALHPSPDYLSLSIGKAGIRALTHGLFEDFKAKGIHVATVTVAGFVNAGTPDSTAVAEQFWQLHRQAQGAWTPEVTYTPVAAAA